MFRQFLQAGLLSVVAVGVTNPADSRSVLTEELAARRTNSSVALTNPDTVPVNSPEEELKRFRPIDGYRLELVAAEPLIHDPIAIDFDADGRIYVVEMRAYMNNIKGTGEDRPIGRVVVLEDTNDDGAMDKSTVFLDSLVMPRAVKVLEHGVLVGVPPNLILARDTNGDLKADTREIIRADYGDPKGNPEHNANGLLWGIDNWIHNANYPGQFKVDAKGSITFREAPEEGQWGLSSDESGRLYRNSNEDPLRTDLVPSYYASRNPNLVAPRGVYERLTPNVAVWPAHKTPAINRGYRPQTLRPDSTLAHYTSAGAPTAYIGDRLPAELKQSVFIAEPAGNMVGRLVVHDDASGMPSARTAYEQKEFLTSTDERFRPVNLANAPDGTLYIVDMYRGIVQHRFFITDYLEQKIIERGLEHGIGMGRIWRLVHSSTTRGPSPRLSAATSTSLVAQLANPTGWYRYTAQRVLVERGDTSVGPALRAMVRRESDDYASLHALWTLDGLRMADASVVTAALGHRSAAVRAAAVRIAEPMLLAGDATLEQAVLRLAGDRDALVRRQVSASVGELPVSHRQDALLQVLAMSGDDPIVADMIVSGLRGNELAFLNRLVMAEMADSIHLRPVLRAIAKSLLSAKDTAGTQRIVNLAGDADRPRWQRLALLEGARPAGPQAAGSTLALASRPAGLVTAMSSKDSSLRAGAMQLAASVRWPGKAVPPAVRPLTSAEQSRFAAGAKQYSATCAGCHQARGTGLTGVAKSLVQSPWVLGAPERLIRIVLHGKEGTMLMPPIGASLSNDQIASVLTYVRRSWGNTAAPIEPSAVQEVRLFTSARKKPWTEEELSRVRR